VIVVDTSALMAILLGEPKGEASPVYAIIISACHWKRRHKIYFDTAKFAC